MILIDSFTYILHTFYKYILGNHEINNITFKNIWQP
jgi:hypothetical protein